MVVTQKLLWAGAMSLAVMGGAARAQANQEETLPVFPAPEVQITHEGLAACRPMRPALREQALVMDLTGAVLATFTLYPDGHVGDVDVSHSDAHPVLREGVASWLSGCSFPPLVATVEWDDGDGARGSAAHAGTTRVTREVVLVHR